MRLARKLSAHNPIKGTATLFLLASLSLLVGCQGFSSGNSATEKQQQTGSLALGASTLNFGSVTTGASKTLSVTLSNNGGTSVNISQASVSGSGFQLSGIIAPLTLNAAQSISLTIAFSPTTSASASGTVVIVSNASDASLSLPLSGTGVSVGELGSNPTSIGFGNVTVGNTQALSETLTNTGGSSVTISQVGVGAGFTLSGIVTPLTLSGGQSANFSVSFDPQSAGEVSSTITVTSTASNATLTIPVSGTGTTAVGQLTVSPATLGLGNVVVGSSGSASGTLTASGASVTVTGASSNNSLFSVGGLSLPLTIPAGQSQSFTVTFTPQAAGAASASLTFTSNAQTSTTTEALTGTGTTAVGQLTVSPATLGLGNVVVGSSGSASGTLTASGASVTVTGASSNNSVFTVGGLSLPVTIPAGQSQPFSVTFSPKVTGAASASLTFSSNAQSSSISEALTGTGTSAPTHSVNLAWDASSSSDISGYNIYRATYGTSCGAYSKINSVLNTTTLYTDSTVADGASYCYAATAVNTSDEESVYSNIISNLQIPAQ